MSKKWSKEEAISYLNVNGVGVNEKVITSPSGLKGLKSCSAVDYLVNHCGYVWLRLLI